MSEMFFPRFPPGEYARRDRALRSAMALENIDAILISGARGSPEVAYLSNYQAQSPCWLLLPRDGDATLFIHFFNHQPCAKAQSIVADVRWYGPTPMPTIVEGLRQRALRKAKIGLVSMRAMAYGNVIELQRQFPEAEFVEFGPQFGRIRRVRSEAELAYLRQSGHFTDLACDALENNLRPSLTEHEVLAIIYNAYLKHGGDPGIHFIATTNMDSPDRFVPWQRQTSRVLEIGSVVITELTVNYWGYSTQIHRKLFDASYECYESVRKICQPGTTSEQIIAATSSIEDAGFSSYESVFHGETGKSPELGTKSAAHSLEKWTLEENMVHVIQPNPITKDFKAGLQLGVAVVVKPNGGEALHNYPLKFPVCG